MRSFQRLLLAFGLLSIAAGCPEMMEDQPQSKAQPPAKSTQPPPPPGPVADDGSQAGDRMVISPSNSGGHEGVGEDGSEPVEEVDVKAFAKEQSAAFELEKMGALVIREGREKQVTSVNFLGQGRKIDKKTAELLPHLFRVMTINLADTDFDGEYLNGLQNNRKLYSLVLGGTQVGDKDMAAVSKITPLVSLFLVNTKITDAGLKHLAELPQLAILDASDTKITDRGLPEIAKIRNLNWLLLAGTEITDAGLPSLAGMPNLSRLTLLDTKVTERGIAALKASKPGLAVDSGTRPKPNGQ